jgi:hypothetical protein
MSETEKKRPYAIDREKRNERRQTVRHGQLIGAKKNKDGTITEIKEDVEKSLERAEGLQIVQEITQSFISSLEFYKSDWGGNKPHDEAVTESLQLYEWRRSYVAGLQPEKVEWGHIAAVAEVSVEDSLKLWMKVRRAAEEELESGWRSANVTGNKTEPYALAQFLAIRDAFADQWQPQGGIESAMIDMLAVSFSLYMYWTTIGHQRAIRDCDEQEKTLSRYETKGWKPPYQYEANAIDQANRLADGYNRQFLRVLRQLRDLRRYSPVVIQNNGGQVNVATDGGQQQVNVKR